MFKKANRFLGGFFALALFSISVMAPVSLHFVTHLVEADHLHDHDGDSHRHHHGDDDHHEFLTQTTQVALPTQVVEFYDSGTSSLLVRQQGLDRPLIDCRLVRANRYCTGPPVLPRALLSEPSLSSRPPPAITA